jgi:hypothetical protein
VSFFALILFILCTHSRDIPGEKKCLTVNGTIQTLLPHHVSSFGGVSNFSCSHSPGHNLHMCVYVLRYLFLELLVTKSFNLFGIMMFLVRVIRSKWLIYNFVVQFSCAGMDYVIKRPVAWTSSDSMVYSGNYSHNYP